jgi:hypothetical protein
MGGRFATKGDEAFCVCSKAVYISNRAKASAVQASIVGFRYAVSAFEVAFS